MLAPLSFDELQSESFIKIERELEELWDSLRRKTPSLDAFLVSQNLFGQSPGNRLTIGALSVALALAAPILGQKRTNQARNRLCAIASRLFKDFSDYSYIILRSNRLWAPRYWEYPWAIVNTQLRQGMEVLDAGSGWSIFPMYLAKQGAHVTAVDTDVVQMNHISPFLARLLSAEVSYRVGDATSLDFPDNMFDRVYCISVLEHLEEETRNGKPFNARKRNLDIVAIQELLRVLKPGGFLAITADWSEQTNNLRSYRFNDIVGRVIKPFQPYLVSKTTPRVDWTSYYPRLLELWQERFPFDTEEQALGEAAAAMGILLRKPA
jgi:2-polyprenyl-3-methyl-5-hydroxy-6-metoxy-1,4-benzoquinol methylase